MSTVLVGNVHEGDIGTKFYDKLLNNGVIFNPVGGTVMYEFGLPDGTILERAATVTGPTSSYYYANYTTIAADITDGLHAEAGDYQRQIKITYGDGRIYSTNIEKYLVYPNV